MNNSKDIISEQGIDISNLSKIDFNTLDMEKIRFAYVLSINSKIIAPCSQYSVIVFLVLYFL